MKVHATWWAHRASGALCTQAGGGKAKETPGGRGASSYACIWLLPPKGRSSSKEGALWPHRLPFSCRVVRSRLSPGSVLWAPSWKGSGTTWGAMHWTRGTTCQGEPHPPCRGSSPQSPSCSRSAWRRLPSLPRRLRAKAQLCAHGSSLTCAITTLRMELRVKQTTEICLSGKNPVYEMSMCTFTSFGVTYVSLISSVAIWFFRCYCLKRTTAYFLKDSLIFNDEVQIKQSHFPRREAVTRRRPLKTRMQTRQEEQGTVEGAVRVLWTAPHTLVVCETMTSNIFEIWNKSHIKYGGTHL